MDKPILILQGMTMSDELRSRLSDMVLSMNDKARAVADTRLKFDDEPAHYKGFLDAAT